MNVTFALVNRNLKVFLRNKTSVFFSFLAIIVIISLYALFLGDVQVNLIQSHFDKYGVTVDINDISWLVNSWIMAGLLSVNTVTITLSSLGVIIEDIESNIIKDFASAPIKRGQIVLGYIISSWVLGILLTVFGFFLVEGYIVFKGGSILTFVQILKVLFVIVLSVISFSSILFFIITFVKSSSAFGTLSTIIGTLIGFLAGIYIPVGTFHSSIQKIASIFPVSFSASMLRQVLMDEPSKKLFAGAEDVKEAYYKFNGIELYLGGFKFEWIHMILILLGISILFYLLSILRVLKNRLSK